MNKILLSTIVVVLLTAGCASKKAEVKKEVRAHKVTHWGYVGEGSPIHWGDLKKEYFMCKEGKNQSPINIINTKHIEKKHIKFRYYIGGESVVYNGHAVQVDYKSGSFVTIDDHKFELKQFHFHTPSENQIEGKSFPLEAHFVHVDPAGNIAVLALMIEEGAKNIELEKILMALSPKVGDKKKLKYPANASSLMPMDVDYYRYNGSLTTPPCSEGVLWVVFKKSVTASKEQIQTLQRVVKHPNNRPIQPINARTITR
jgi:carbonic anhydrase